MPEGTGVTFHRKADMGHRRSRGQLALTSWGPTTDRMPRRISPKLLALFSLASQLQRDTSMLVQQGSTITHVTLPMQPAITKARRPVLGKEP